MRYTSCDGGCLEGREVEVKKSIRDVRLGSLRLFLSRESLKLARDIGCRSFVSSIRHVRNQRVNLAKAIRTSTLLLFSPVVAAQLG